MKLLFTLLIIMYSLFAYSQPTHLVMPSNRIVQPDTLRYSENKENNKSIWVEILGAKYELFGSYINGKKNGIWETSKSDFNECLFNVNYRNDTALEIKIIIAKTMKTWYWIFYSANLDTIHSIIYFNTIGFEGKISSKSARIYKFPFHTIFYHGDDNYKYSEVQQYYRNGNVYMHNILNYSDSDSTRAQNQYYPNGIIQYKFLQNIKNLNYEELKFYQNGKMNTKVVRKFSENCAYILKYSENGILLKEVEYFGALPQYHMIQDGVDNDVFQEGEEWKFTGYNYFEKNKNHFIHKDTVLKDYMRPYSIIHSYYPNGIIKNHVVNINNKTVINEKFDKKGKLIKE